MIQVENLTKSYGGDEIFSDISFSIQSGERCGLVGRNGSGKTTLFRLITGQEIPDKGRVNLPKNYRLGYLDQHIKFTRPTLLEEGALGLPKGEEESLYKVEKILGGLGFTQEDMYRSPHDFSGGFQLRLHLAKVILSEPDCLLLDEPTNYLDIVSIQWLQKTLQQWKGEFVLISHDREFMDSVTTHTMGLHRNRLRKYEGSTIDFYTQIVQEEEVQEKTRQKMEKKKQHLQSFIERFGAKATKAAQAQSKAKMLSRIPVLEKLNELNQLQFNFIEAAFGSRIMIEADHLTFGYPPEEGKKPEELIKNLSLQIEKGDRIAIIGKNGRGKSTILKLLAGELEQQQGNVKRSENMKLGYFGQTNIQRLNPKKRIDEEISNANHNLNITQIKNICGIMMFSGDKANKLISVLSGGEKSRVLLGKILATPCNLLMLDEPTHHLDMESIEALIDAIEDFEGAAVVVTHSELILKRLPLDKIVICRKNHQEVFIGNYQDFLDRNGWEEEEAENEKSSSAPIRENAGARRSEAAINARVLKDLENLISKKEALLLQLEETQHKDYDDLALVSTEGKRELINEISDRVTERQGKIDALYTELEQLLTRRDNLKK